MKRLQTVLLVSSHLSGMVLLETPTLFHCSMTFLVGLLLK